MNIKETLYKNRLKTNWFLYDNKAESALLKTIVNYPLIIKAEDVAKYLKIELVKTKDFITNEEALADLEQLAYIIKYCYAGYNIWGQDSLTSYLKTIKKWFVNKKNISVKEITEKLTQEFNFDDIHFRYYLDNKRYSPYENAKKPYITYYNVAYLINYLDNAYYIIDNNHKYLIEEINGDLNVAKYIKSYLNQEGKLCYGIFTCFRAINAERYLTIKYNNVINKIGLSKLRTAKADGKTILEITKADNYWYIKSNSCGLENAKDQKEFDLKLEELKNIPKEANVILDVRGNIGGTDEVAIKIMNNLGCIYDQYNSHQIKLCCRILHDDQKYDNNLFYNKFIENYQQSLIAGTPNILEKKIMTKPVTVTALRNIALLQDRYTFSAGEAYIELFSQSNKLFYLGDNTGGATHFGDNSSYFLTNSGIELVCANSYFTNVGNEFIEGLGCAPDIYLLNNESIDSINNFLYKNGIFK